MKLPGCWICIQMFVISQFFYTYIVNSEAGHWTGHNMMDKLGDILKEMTQAGIYW